LFIIIKDENDRISLSQLLRHPLIKEKFDFFKNSISLRVPSLPYLISSSLDFYGNNNNINSDDNSLPKIKAPLYVYTMAAKYLQSTMELSSSSSSSSSSPFSFSMSTPKNFFSTPSSLDSPLNSSFSSSPGLLPSLNSSPSSNYVFSPSSFTNRNENNSFHKLPLTLSDIDTTPENTQKRRRRKKNANNSYESNNPKSEEIKIRSPDYYNRGNAVRTITTSKNSSNRNTESLGQATISRTVHTTTTTTTEHISKRIDIKLVPLRQGHKYDDLKRKSTFNFHLPERVFIDTPENKTKSVLRTFSKIGTSNDEGSKLLFKSFENPQLNSNSTPPSIRHTTLQPIPSPTTSIVKHGFFSSIINFCISY
jgi:hypothetical protein